MEGERSQPARTAGADAVMAQVLHPADDVATALTGLAAGTRVPVRPGLTVELRDDIPAGHKFSIRPLSGGVRVRKYGEYIGRLADDLPAGGWVHTHNLATTARGIDFVASARLDGRGAAIVAVLGETANAVGESPVYDARHDRLFWVDVRDTPGVFRLDRRSGELRHWPLAEDIGSFVPSADGRLLACLRSGFAFFDGDTGAFEPILDPEPDRPQTRLNDGKCDRAGRLWCGSMNPESGIAEGRLYRLDPDGRCSEGPGRYLTPNGPVFSLDGATFTLADTRRSLIWRHDYDLGSGTLGPAQPFADLAALPGGPDGATIDSEGFLWSAQWDGGCLLRLDPAGRVDRVVRVPVSRPTSCCFGGPDHRLLFVTTATRGLDADRHRAEPLAGRVLVLDVGVGGQPADRFGTRGLP